MSTQDAPDFETPDLDAIGDAFGPISFIVCLFIFFASLNFGLAIPRHTSFTAYCKSARSRAK